MNEIDHLKQIQKEMGLIKNIGREFKEANKTLSSIRTFVIAQAQLIKKQILEQQKTNDLLKEIKKLMEAENDEH